ncbi:MAG: hypothetical protein B6D35_13045 [Candidatus Brocadia sp. UTAMX2]|nr:MAG: hypothetical protein B6D35_13045 [Candidatus Brocadia sp. UTAMX2]
MKYKKRDTDTNGTAPSITFKGSQFDRNASSIHIRIIRIKDKCYPLYIRLDAPFIEVKEEHGAAAIGRPTGNILDTFCTNIKAIGSIT